MALRLSTGLRQAMLGTASFDATFTACFINIYTGTQPATADTAASGTLLATIYSNNPTDTVGLNFEVPAVAGTISKAVAETWAGTALATGTAGWYRMWPAAGNPAILSTTESRVDGNISTSGANMNMSSTSIVQGTVQTVSTFDITLPAS
jgi:hypothetical protein